MRKGGLIVLTRNGPGITKYSDHPIQGKVLVYLDSGGRLMIDRRKLKVVGYWD